MSFTEEQLSWVITFFPRTSNKDYFGVRLFKSVSDATNYYSKSARSRFVFANHAEIAARCKVPQLKEYLKELVQQFSNEKEQYTTSLIHKNRLIELTEHSGDEILQSNDINALSRAFWNLAQLIGDRVVPQLFAEENEDKYKIMLDRMTCESGQDIIQHMPRQARIIANALIRNDEKILDKNVVEQLVVTLVKRGELKTKQEPIKIWNFYAPELADYGFIYYPGKRHKTEDHDEQMGNLSIDY